MGCYNEYMKRLTALLFILAALACACAAPAPLPQATATPSPPQATPAPARGGCGLLEPRYENDGVNEVIYPYVYGAAFAPAANAHIREAVDGLLPEGARRVDYRVACHREGVISLVFFAYDQTSYEARGVACLTLDCAGGGVVDMRALFDDPNERWRAVLPDIVTEQAAARELPLISDVMPARDDQLYYLCDEGLVLVYRLYEIAAYAAGWPTFVIPYHEAAQLAYGDSPLLRLAQAEPAATASAQAGGEK